MISKLKDIFRKVKTSSDYRLEFIVGIWSVVIILALFSISGFAYAKLSNKKDKTASTPGPTEVAETATPGAIAAVPTSTPDVFSSDDTQDDTQDEDDTTNTGETETVYVIATLNIRDAASTNSNVIGRVTKGETLERIQKMNNGWSKVLYNGKEGYAKNEFLSKTKPEETVVSTPTPTKTPVATKTPKATATPKPTTKPKTSTTTTNIYSTPVPKATAAPVVTPAPTTAPIPEPTKEPVKTDAPANVTATSTPGTIN